MTKVVILATVVAACATSRPSFGVSAQCRTSADCATGLVCLQHETFAGSIDRWTCELPCRLPSDGGPLCPSGLRCSSTADEGPPGRLCR